MQASVGRVSHAIPKLASAYTMAVSMYTHAGTAGSEGRLAGAAIREQAGAYHTVPRHRRRHIILFLGIADGISYCFSASPTACPAFAYRRAGTPFDRLDMCVDMCIHLCVSRRVHRHVHRHVHRNVHRHVCKHVCRHACRHVCRHVSRHVHISTRFTSARSALPAYCSASPFCTTAASAILRTAHSLALANCVHTCA